MHCLAIAERIFPVFSRKQSIARISHEFRDIKKTENVKKIRELSTRTCKQMYCAKKGQKWEKRSKKAKNSLAHPLVRAKKEFIALRVKIKINEILFQSLCY